jgi:hypothetical protein
MELISFPVFAIAVVVALVLFVAGLFVFSGFLSLWLRRAERDDRGRVTGWGGDDGAMGSGGPGRDSRGRSAQDADGSGDGGSGGGGGGGGGD